MENSLDTTNDKPKKRKLNFGKLAIWLGIISVYGLFIAKNTNAEAGLGVWFPVFLINLGIFIMIFLFAVLREDDIIKKVLLHINAHQFLLQILWVGTGIYWLIIK